MEQKTWLIIAGVIGGAIVLVVLVVGACLAGSIFFGISRTSMMNQPQQPIPTAPPILFGPITPTVGRQEEGGIEAQMEAVEKEVAGLRGLTEEGDVPRFFISTDELRQRVIDDFFGDYSVEDARDDVVVLAAFGLLPPDFDLREFYIALYSEQTAGFYDPKTGGFYVIDEDEENFSATDEFVYAHEFTHALQDQAFNLKVFLHYKDEEWQAANGDEALARQALVEGDAMLAQSLYLATMPQERIGELFAEFEGVEMTVFEGAPAFLKADFYFPYTEGLAFVRALYEAGGYGMVDTAFQYEPPVSTEQILHPERYLEGDEPQAVQLVDGPAILGGSYRLVRSGSFGEFYLRLYLGQFMAEGRAIQAAEGWDGDRFAVYEAADGSVIWMMRTAWDSPGEAEDFFEALVSAWAAGPGRGGAVCHAVDGDVVCVERADGETALVQAPDEGMAQDLLASVFE